MRGIIAIVVAGVATGQDVLHGVSMNCGGVSMGFFEGKLYCVTGECGKYALSASGDSLCGEYQGSAWASTALYWREGVLVGYSYTLAGFPASCGITSLDWGTPAGTKTGSAYFKCPI